VDLQEQQFNGKKRESRLGMQARAALGLEITEEISPVNSGSHCGWLKREVKTTQVSANF
jgi:hypothetical protein